MDFKERLLADFKQAMIEKDEIRKNTVTMIRAAVLQTEKDKRIILEDAGVLEVIAKELKKRKDVLPEYEKSGRENLIHDLKREMEIITQYLPDQMSEEELRTLVHEAVKEAGAQSMQDIGRVMGIVMPKIKGRADGRQVNQILKEMFG